MADMMTPALEVVKIDDSSYRIENGGVRSLLFVGTDRALLVDTGFGGGESLKEVIDTITDKPVTLVISHADMDHIGCNAEFDIACMHPAEMSHYFASVGKSVPVAPLWEGDIIDIGGRSFEVILIPGHTPGSIALLDRENRILISGDSISEAPIYMFSEARNIYAFMESLKKLLTMTDAFDTVYPSHGPFPLGTNQISVVLEAAKKLAAGELEPQEPPYPLPAKMYSHNGGMFFY